MAPKAAKKWRPNDGWGVGRSHRFVGQVIRDIGTLTGDEQVAALRRAPRAVRELLFFCYAPHDIELPRGQLTYVSIPTEAFVGAPALGDDDLLAAEASRMTRLFAAGVHPTLTDARRLELWKSIMERLPRAEVELMDGIRIRREVPGISREVVVRAFPGLLDAPPAPDAPVPDVTYAASAMDNPTPIHEATAPQSPREATERERHYDQLMRAIWG